MILPPPPFKINAYGLGQGVVTSGAPMDPEATGQNQGNVDQYMQHLMSMMRRLRGTHQTMANYASDGGQNYGIKS